MFAFLLPAFLTGVLGAGHCAVMCGGVASAVCARKGGASSVTFNAGRVLTYTLLGALAGAFGAISPLVGIALRPIAAIALVALGLHLAGVSRLFVNVEKLGLPLWKRLAPIARRPLHPAMLGAVWGFVPCGLVYAALTLAANAGSALGGASTMLAFGAGTLPVMTLLGTVGHWFMRYRRVAGVAVLVLGIHQTTLAIASVDLSLGGAKHACCPAKR